MCYSILAHLVERLTVEACGKPKRFKSGSLKDNQLVLGSNPRDGAI